MSKKSAGYYKPETLNKFSLALNDAAAAVIAGHETRVRISACNTKMGNVASVSTLPFITCPACCAETCGRSCYAAKLANLRPAVLKAYAINTALAIHAPDLFWDQVNKACAGVRFFRFHVSGDILNADYFKHMIETAANNPHTEILVFTKRFQIVNDFIGAGGTIPENMHILFSGWTNLQPDNPHNMPETNVIMPGTEKPDSWTLCGGNCYDCAIAGAGCWTAQAGETIAFPLH